MKNNIIKRKSNKGKEIKEINNKRKSSRSNKIKSNNSNINKTITLRNFLIKYTAIPIKFIDNHLKFYDMCKINSYGINLVDVMDYLDIKKRKKFIKGLKERFTENIDYQKVYINKKREKNDNVTKYFINLDTFEKICMTTKTEKGNAVRDYFILLRKFIDYYKININDMIINNNSNVIYIFLVNKNKNIYKIGKSTNIRNRLYNYITGRIKHPDIKFIIRVNNPDKIEKCTKSLLKSYKGNKEIYKVNFDYIKSAIFTCATMQKQLSEISENNIDAYVLFDTYN